MSKRGVKKAAKGTTGKAGKGADKSDILALIEQIFSLADDDQSGCIGFSEFLNHHKKIVVRAGGLNRSDAMDDNELERSFRKHDTDCSQSLDRKEFVSYMEAVFDMVGQRSFMQVCQSLIEEETQRRKTLQDGFNASFSARLLDQARTANFYKDKMKADALKFLEQNADPNYRDTTGSHVLIYAADKSDDVFIAQLIEARANPTICNKDLECAAFVASRARQMDVCSVLLLPTKKAVLEEGQHEKVVHASQDLVTKMAQMTGHDVRDLLAKKADLNYRHENGWTPLTAAVFWGKHDCVDVLLKTQSTSFAAVKLRTDGFNGKGRAALHIAARKGRSELIPPILAHRGDPDLQDSDGWTPLHHAVFNGMDAAVQELLKGNANIHIQGRNGMTPWMVTKMPEKAGSLTDTTMKLLEPSEFVNFSKCIIPVLKDESLSAYEKLATLLDLPGVYQGARNLRLYEQFFDARGGPNKVRLVKMWQSLSMPMLRRLYDGATDLEEPGPHLSEDAAAGRWVEIRQRQTDQKNFIKQWLLDTKGPRLTPSWKHDNRAGYKEDLQKVIEEELQRFKKELDNLHAKLLEQECGQKLVSLAAEEILNSQCMTQLDAHPIPLWLEQPDPAGAFEALRLVKAAGMGKDDDDSVLCFIDLLTQNHDFLNGKGFWKNVYRLWLRAYAHVAESEFHKGVQSLIAKYHEQHPEEEMRVVFKQVPVKSYERIKGKERQFGEASHDTYKGRTVAANILDVVRNSITVKCPKAAIVLIEDYFKPLKKAGSKMELVRLVNRFNDKAETLAGYRNIEMNIMWNGGLRASACGRASHSMQVCIIGEVQIVLDSFLNVRRRRHLLYKCSRGAFDWHAADAEVQDAKLCGEDDDHE